MKFALLIPEGENIAEKGRAGLKKNMRSVAIPGIIMSTVWAMFSPAALSNY
jgi:hypothetical protein